LQKNLEILEGGNAAAATALQQEKLMRIGISTQKCLRK
jgi:hypothetical protein